MRRSGMGREILDAYARLFGASAAGVAPSDLTLVSLRKAFRARAFAVHPDRASLLGRPETCLADELREVVQANAVLLRYLEQQRSPPACSDAIEDAIEDAIDDQAESFPVPNCEGLYRGALPMKRLRFGEFLYFTSQISGQELEAALSWQQGSRPKFGELAYEWGLLTRAQLSLLLREKPAREPLGEVAVARFVMSREERDRLLREQRELQRRIGEYFVEANVLLASDVRAMAERHREHNDRVRRAA